MPMGRLGGFDGSGGFDGLEGLMGIVACFWSLLSGLGIVWFDHDASTRKLKTEVDLKHNSHGRRRQPDQFAGSLRYQPPWHHNHFVQVYST